jgi:hypothetical protein
MPTEMEKLRANRAKQEELAKKQAETAKATVAAQAEQGAQVQTQDILVTVSGLLKARAEDGTEKGVSQEVTLKVPVGTPKSVYAQLMPQLWTTMLRQVGGLQNEAPDGSFVFYPTDLFERFSAKVHEVVGVSI